MNLIEKKNELIKLISKYLNNQATLGELQEFAWEIIEYFSNKKNELPARQDFEKEFWYTIWQIQHLADEAHEKKGITKQVFVDALDYLKKNKKIPATYIGLRP